jgi:CheY-like chemotaxis protein/anti-sigma regulatory factor (Ser/Thr protein kinase)
VNLKDLLESCSSIIDGQLLNRKVDFVKDFDGVRDSYVLADALHLRQILINILGNAVKFTHDGGTITFRAQQVEEAANSKALYRFECIDTGIGMAQEYLTKIFEPFSQEGGGSNSRTHYQGTGLGMAITKQFVDKMGGTITVESEQGKGSRFTVELTFDIDQEAAAQAAAKAEAAAKAAAEAAQADEDVSLEGMKVLLVEDNELNMEIAQELLEDEGMNVTTAENGQIAVDNFSQAPAGTYDVILMDIMMPVLDGHGATRAIRALPRDDAKTIPIIAMTANAYAEDVKAALDCGMNAHVAKPIDVDRLFSLLQQYRSAPAGA